MSDTELDADRSTPEELADARSSIAALLVFRTEDVAAAADLRLCELCGVGSPLDFPARGTAWCSSCGRSFDSVSLVAASATGSPEINSMWALVAVAARARELLAKLAPR